MIEARSDLLSPPTGREPLFETQDVAIRISEVEPFGITPLVRSQLVLHQNAHSPALELSEQVPVSDGLEAIPHDAKLVKGGLRAWNHQIPIVPAHDLEMHL